MEKLWNLLTMTWKLTPPSLILSITDGKLENLDSVDTLLETIRSVAAHTGLLALLSACMFTSLSVSLSACMFTGLSVSLSACIFTGLSALLSACMFIWMHLCTAHCLLLCPLVPLISFLIPSFFQISIISLISCTNHPSLSWSSSKPENYQLFWSSSHPIFSCPLPLIFSLSLSHFY